MRAIFVHPDFAALVDGYCAVYTPHLRLGARIVDNGPHAGKGLVTTDLITCTPEWTTLFSSFVVGQPTMEPGTTVTLRDVYGVEWTYEVHFIPDPSVLFNPPEEPV